MESLKDIAERQQRSGPTYFDDPGKDRMLRLMLELAEEVCVLRDRLDTGIRLSESGAGVTADAIDEYKPGDALTESRLAAHQAFYEELFRKLGE